MIILGHLEPHEIQKSVNFVLRGRKRSYFPRKLDEMSAVVFFLGHFEPHEIQKSVNFVLRVRRRSNFPRGTR